MSVLTLITVKADYVPDGASEYLTPGKIYDCSMISPDLDLGEIVTDLGERTMINVKKCAHLLFHPWTIVDDDIPTPVPAGYRPDCSCETRKETPGLNRETCMNCGYVHLIDDARDE